MAEGSGKFSGSWVIITMLIPILLWTLFAMIRISDLQSDLKSGRIQVQCK